MRSGQDGFALTRLVVGLGIAAVGLILSLDRLGVLDAEAYLEYWPLILVAIGLTKITGGRPPDLVFALFFIGLGGWLLLYNLGFTDAEPWGYFWPLMLLLIGSFLVAGGLRGRGSTRESDDFVRGFAILGGFERNIASANFQGADLTAVMGGCEVDLRQSKIESATSTIDVFAFWGGVEVRVPQDWRLEVKAWPILGGVVDETEQTPSPGSPVVTIKGAAIMGGVGIKN